MEQTVKASHVLIVGSFLPHSALPAAPGGSGVALRSRGREATVAVRIHGATCGACRLYLTELAMAAGDFTWWDGRVVVLVPGSLVSASELRAELELPFTVLSDADGRAPLGEGSGVVIADRYEQVYYVGEAGEGHELLSPREMEEWLKFLATRCPECGVPDEPGPGDWGD